MKISIPALLLSTAVSICIFTILTFVVVWLGFPAEKPQDSFKDALDFSGGIFAGSTTFGAAVIAAHLFNDWKEQHNKSVLAHEAKELHKLLIEFPLSIIEYDLLLKERYSSPSFIEKLDDIIKKNQYNVINLNNFYNLSGDKKILDYTTKLSHRIKRHLELSDDLTTNNPSVPIEEVHVEVENFKSDIIFIINSIITILQGYIFIK
ncbi:hypothetical protein IL972_00265 [Acinetobacter sp. FL51]|uniref:hypothetical protein n=1 Tax=Acinetobacter sp. FL51 TaxID=2777978 RepID=UPI0018E1532C|nr:hypothetical protein [Acinetobacter sp. FL51]MBI1450371.1 hypothetical protein [Acinetobacter sp. FL51]